MNIADAGRGENESFLIQIQLKVHTKASVLKIQPMLLYIRT